MRRAFDPQYGTLEQPEVHHTGSVWVEVSGPRRPPNSTNPDPTDVGSGFVAFY